MKIIFFSHPAFLGSQSMPRYTQWLADGMKSRGHEVEVWIPQPVLFNLSVPQVLKKWMGYIDQYILFPVKVKRKLKTLDSRALFVFTDHALGPWVHLVSDRYHVIHCHDFLAQRSALNEIPENPTGWTGKIYQTYIRQGFKKGKNFISISKKTQEDLHKFLTATPQLSEIIYNGLTQPFLPAISIEDVRFEMQKQTGIAVKEGYILHIGGNQWYKNRTGVIEIYNAWRTVSKLKLPLIMIGPKPTPSLLSIREDSIFINDIYFLVDVSNDFIMKAYNGATVFLFPSLDEGFGWPIAEAMASGCPVITTDETPMKEVANNSSFFINRRPFTKNESVEWAAESAKVVVRLITLSRDKRNELIQSGLENIKRFDSDLTLEKIENLYKKIVANK